MNPDITHPPAMPKDGAETAKITNPEGVLSGMSYTKPWKSFGEQLDLLISRGLIVTDRAKALEYLQRIGPPEWLLVSLPRALGEIGVA